MLCVKATSPDILRDWLDFISQIIHWVAWPLAMVLLFLIFRRIVRRLLKQFIKRMGSLRRVKGPGGIEAEWIAESVEDVSSKAEGLPVPDPQTPPHPSSEPPSRLTPKPDPKQKRQPESSPQQSNIVLGEMEQIARAAAASGVEDDLLRELARVQPAAAIVAAFIPVERALEFYIRSVDMWPDLKGPVTSMRALREATKRGLDIDHRIDRIVRELSQIRNVAAHESDANITIETALSYIDTAARARAQLFFMAGMFVGLNDHRAQDSEQS